MTQANTIASVKKRLATAFPDVEFAYGVGGQGRQRGHLIAWQGGPSEGEVRTASQHPWKWNGKRYHFQRQMSEAESQAHWAAWDAEQPVREAARAARIVENRANGRIAAAATRAANKALAAQLATQFPETSFQVIGGRSPSWTDGPTEGAVVAFLGGGTWEWQCERTVTPEVGQREAEDALRLRDIEAFNRQVEAKRTAEEKIAVRIQRRLAKSKARALRVAEYWLRVEAASRQLCFSFRYSFPRVNAAAVPPLHHAA